MGSASSNGRHPTKDEAQPNPLNTQKYSFAKREEEDKWADFYSTREILDVIEKDLNRLPTDHYTVYHSKRMRDRVRKGESEHRGSGGSASSSARGDDSEDTAPTRQNNARRRKRLGSNFAQSLQLGLNPNFARLNSIEDEEDDRKKAELLEKAEIETSTKERAEKLSRLLFVYAKEHECIGYRQGMHEILSYILLVLEMDLTEYSLGAERRKWRDASNGGSEPGGMAGVDSSGNIVVVRLLDEKYAMHDAFTLFECVMEALTASYDVEMGDRESISSDNIPRGCLEAMTNSIVSKIRYVARDEALFGHVLYMPVPPQLYFAKWVRLMFCREVAGGIEAVMKLWDAFFELAAATASMDEDVDISKALINVLKTAAASMILLIRHLLLAPTVAWDGSLTGDPDPNDGISFLMNYPPIEDIGVLVKTITSLLAKEKMMAAKAARQDGREQIVTEKRRHSLTSYDPIVAIKKQPDQQEEDTMSRYSSRGDFMGWPSREKLEAQNNDAPVIIPSAGDLKMMRSSIISSANSVEEDSDADENEPSETFGEFAAGMWNKSTQDLKESFKRTMSFTGIKFLEEDIQHHNIENGSRGQSTNEDNFSAELLEQSDRLLGESDGRDDDPTLIEVIHTELSDSNTKGKVPRRRQHSLSVDSLNNDDLCQSSLPGSNDGDNVSVYSHSSRLSTMSVSKSLSETCRKDPKELAAKLEKSVASLMKHFNDQICAHADTNGVRPNNQHQPIMIPEDIWDAMADIDQVRKDLMAQCATEQLDKAPSSASLYGLKFKALQYSTEHDKELCDSVKDEDKVVHRRRSSNL
jgi:TBC1 domain family protein 5